MRQFLEAGQYSARDTDDRIRVSQIMSRGGNAVQKAGQIAMNGTMEDIRAFLAFGQYVAAAKDEAAARKKAAEAAAKEKAAAEAAAEEQSAGGVRPASVAAPVTATPAPTTPAPAATAVAAAVGLGAAMVVTARRRSADER